MEVPATLAVLPWADPVIDPIGHDPRSRYVELFWLGVLGPTATLLRSRMYSTSRPSGDQLGRTAAVSSKVIREKGPVGSRLTQMSALPFRRSSTASALPSGASAMFWIDPCGSQPGSSGAALPSRFTQ